MASGYGDPYVNVVMRAFSLCIEIAGSGAVGIVNKPAVVPASAVCDGSTFRCATWQQVGHDQV
jgi:hypothetical protein